MEAADEELELVERDRVQSPLAHCCCCCCCCCSNWKPVADGAGAREAMVAGRYPW